ncbi:MAG: DNA mismatch repair protein MutT, partial [Mesorhizobium sp.]
RATGLRPLREIHIDGRDDSHPVDYLLTVFGGAYAGGEAVASDDAETAAFYTLKEMTLLPLVGSVFAVAEELLGPLQTH